MRKQSLRHTVSHSAFASHPHTIQISSHYLAFLVQQNIQRRRRSDDDKTNQRNMSLLEPAGSSSRHEPLPSLPPSPTEEDLGGASVWRDGDGDDDDDDDDDRRVHGNGNAKGKQKQRVQEISLDEEEESEGAVTPTLDGGYPPQKEDEDESRKVEENLRRWELAERQRRKASRESTVSVAPSTTGSTTAGRGPSLWSGRLRSGSGGGATGAGSRAHTVHTQLGQNSEDALPLSDLHGSNTLISPGASKPPSPVENPFEPPDSATPLSLSGFPGDGELDASAVMRPSSPPPPTPAGGRAPEGSPFDDSAATARPTLQATSSFSQPIPHPLSNAPPPMPLDLPPPKTPPPRTRTPGGAAIPISSPPGRVPAPSPRATTHRMEQEQGQEHRWWTDWLCGCREEKDRDNAGRTNPFE